MRRFIILWFGQMISMMGSAMSRFALTIWLWGETGEATALVLVGFFATLAGLLISPFAGSLVDRVNRKTIIMLGDLGAGVPTVIVLILFISGGLQPWHLYAAAFIAAACGMFQHLAFRASVTMIVPEKDFQRANGMGSLAQYLAAVSAPALASLLIGLVGVPGVLLVDVITFLFAVTTTALIPIPNPQLDLDETAPRQVWWRDWMMGAQYVWKRPPLRGLLIVFTLFLFFESFAYPLIVPMLLARTGGDEVTVGIVQSFMGLSGVIGGALVSVWGGFKKRTTALLLGMALTALFGDALMGLGRGLPVWLIAAVGIELFIPLIVAADGAIWQAKIPPALQGRVFAFRQVIGQSGELIGLLGIGILADRVFEPVFMGETALSGLFGSGRGAGMGVMLALFGVLTAGAALWGWLNPNVRDAERLLTTPAPDPEPAPEKH